MMSGVAWIDAGAEGAAAHVHLLGRSASGEPVVVSTELREAAPARVLIRTPEAPSSPLSALLTVRC
jgi:hypothetical protein